MHGTWFNLNSTNTFAPQVVSDFYLQVFLDSIQENGYLVFLVEGIFPENQPDGFLGELQDNQRFLTMQEVLERHEADIKMPGYKLNSGGSDQMELERVMAESLKEYQKSQKTDEKINEPVKTFDNTGGEESKNLFGGQGVQLGNDGSGGFVKCWLIRYTRG